MSMFFLRQKLNSILTAAQKSLGFTRATYQEVRKMSASMDNLNAAVAAAVNQLGALSKEVADLKAEIAASGGDAAAEQAAADKLTAAINANPI
jgi:chromosome segregation ATPase